MTNFDPSYFTRSPQITVTSGIGLARSLADACPEDAPEHVKKACLRLVSAADGAQAALADRQRADADGGSESRPTDSAADNSWTILRMRLKACASLPVEDFPDADRAQELLDFLFGSAGLGFLKESYIVQYTTADTILNRIDQDGLQADIDRLAGPEYLAHVRALHDQYGEMVNDQLQSDGDGGVDMRAHRRSLQRAIVIYATAMAATVDDELPETARIATTALQPLVSFRAQNARRLQSRNGAGRGGGIGDSEGTGDSEGIGGDAPDPGQGLPPDGEVVDAAPNAGSANPR